MPESSSGLRLSEQIHEFIERSQKAFPFEDFYTISRSDLHNWERWAYDLDASKGAKVPLCENCDFFAGKTDGKWGPCRKRAPVGNPHNADYQFPSMLTTDWCGEHRWKYTQRNATAQPKFEPSTEVQPNPKESSDGL